MKEDRRLRLGGAIPGCGNTGSLEIMTVDLKRSASSGIELFCSAYLHSSEKSCLFIPLELCLRNATTGRLALR
jgi:hypothetical protein